MKQSSSRALLCVTGCLAAVAIGLTAMGVVQKSKVAKSPPPKPMNQAERIASVKEWRLHVEFTCDGKQEFTESGKLHSYTTSINGSADFKLDEKDIDEGKVHWGASQAGCISGNLNFSVLGKWTEDGKTVTVYSGNASGPVNGSGFGLSVWPSKGTYSFVGGSCQIAKGGAFSTEILGPQKTNDWRPHVPMFGIADIPTMHQQKPLPQTGIALSGTNTFDFTNLAFVSFPKDPPLKVTVRWTLTPWQVEPDAEATFDVTNAQQAPEPGSPYNVKVAWKGRIAMVRATLDGVSREPGTCMNSAKDDTEPDLKIPPQGDWEVDERGAATVAVLDIGKPGAGTADLHIDATDYGGWGQLKVEVFTNGKWKAAKIAATGATEAALPRDDNGNHIADEWEKDLTNKVPSSDDDKSYGNTTDGDGFTLYEEYRGLMAKGKHIRLDPRRKELCVVNMLQEKTRPGLALFEKASNIRVVELFRTEFDPSRVVNFRKNTVAKGGDQYGLLLGNGETLTGLARMVGTDGPTAMSRSPKKCQQINFSLEFDKWGPEAAAADTAHEIGHACGLKHHGDAADASLDSSLTDAQGRLVIPASRTDFQIFDEAGAPITTRPYIIANRKMVGYSDRSMTSGDIRCIMCCTQCFLYAYRFAGGAHQLAKVPNLPIVGDRFCTAVTGTHYNKPDNQPWPLFGDANPVRGNCLSKIRVKDW